jgi:hypothetical protein
MESESTSFGLTGKFLQIFFAIVLVIIFLLIGFAIYNFEMLKSIKSTQDVQVTTPIFQGIIDFNSTQTMNFNTLNNTNPLDPTYRNLGNSTNQPGGAEFTYNFWLYIDPTGGTSTLPKQKITKFFDPKEKSSLPTKTSGVYTPDYGLDTNQLILFTRGSKDAAKYNSVCGKEKVDVMTKCPLVKLENSGDVLTVEFNTVQGPDAVTQNARNTCNDKSTDWNYMNSYKLGIKNLKATYPAEWFMVTLVITDTYPSDPLPLRNKARCQIYINGAIQLDKYVDGKIRPPSNSGSSILLQNQGNLYVAPVISFTPLSGSKKSTVGGQNALVDQAKSVCMADLTYMNFNPTPGQISSLYSSGFTQSYAPTFTAPSTSSGAIANSANSFMSSLSTNTNPNAVSQLYSPKM